MRTAKMLAYGACIILGFVLFVSLFQTYVTHSI